MKTNPANEQRSLSITLPFSIKLFVILTVLMCTAGLGLLTLQYQTRKTLYRSFSYNYASYLAHQVSQLMIKRPEINVWQKDGSLLSTELRTWAPISGLSGIIISNEKGEIVSVIPIGSNCRPDISQGHANITVAEKIVGSLSVCLETTIGAYSWDMIDLLSVGTLTSRVGNDYGVMAAGQLAFMISHLEDPEAWAKDVTAINQTLSTLSGLHGVLSVGIFSKDGDFIAHKYFDSSGQEPVLTTRASISYKSQIVGHVIVDIDFPQIRAVEDAFESYVYFGTVIALIVLFGFPVVIVRRLEGAARASFQALHDSHKQLQETQLQLVNTARMAALGTMASGIAHEINNPLTIIGGAANRLRSHAKDPNLSAKVVEASATKISNTVFRIAKIVKSLRGLSRDGKRDPFSETRLHTIVHEGLEISHERTKNMGIDLKIGEIPMDLTIECQTVQIEQVLLNLVNNACDAIESLTEKWVRVDVEKRETDVVISVTDSGPGIPEHVRATLFQPFVTSKPVGKGTGLGLSLSRQIAEVHGGYLELDVACPNTRFVLRIPIRHSPASSSIAA